MSRVPHSVAVRATLKDRRRLVADDGPELNQRLCDCASAYFEVCSGIIDGKAGDKFEVVIMLDPEAEKVHFADLVASELASAREKHKPLNSAHEAFAVILEELDEFWEETRKKREDRDDYTMLRELIQIAAMAQRAAEDLGIVP